MAVFKGINLFFYSVLAIKTIKNLTFSDKNNSAYLNNYGTIIR